MTSTPQSSDTGIQVAAICGSLRPGSITAMALRLALEGAAEKGARVRLIDLRDYNLAFCDGESGEDHYPEGVNRLREDIRAAKGLLLGTPEYHGSYSGVLKNALDLMGFQEFEGKIVGLIGVAGGVMGGLEALTGLRTVCRSLHAWVLPQQAMVARSHQAFDDRGRMKEPRLAERLREVGREVASFACLHNAGEAWKFVREFEKAPENPGGE